jgi:hypothetical protein
LKYRERELEKNKQYCKNNPEKRKECCKRWRENNVKKKKESAKQYRKNNHKKIQEYNNHRCKTNLKVNLNHKIKCAIWFSLKGNKLGRHWEDLVGYTLVDLKKRLKKTMLKGYVWKDFLNGRLQIDHIIPKSIFNFTKPEHPDFKKCWALENLRLLPSKENLIKHNKLDKPFQPSLKIEI